MAAFHKVKFLLGGCSFGKFNFDHFSSVLRRTRYFPSSIFPDALRIYDRNSTCMWMRTLLIRLRSSAENPQCRNSLISHFSPQRGRTNGVSLNSTITSNRSRFSLDHGETSNTVCMLKSIFNQPKYPKPTQ